MSRRSYNSFGSERRISKFRVTDDDVFKCVDTDVASWLPIHIWLLQLCSQSGVCIAFAGASCYLTQCGARFLVYLTQPKVVDSSVPEPEAREKDATATTRITDAISHSIFSLGDMFKDSSSAKNVRFPEKLLKALEQKLANIAMGKDPA